MDPLSILNTLINENSMHEWGIKEKNELKSKLKLLKNQELKEMLVEMRLKKSGNKDQLSERLAIAHINQNLSLIEDITNIREIKQLINSIDLNRILVNNYRETSHRYRSTYNWTVKNHPLWYVINMVDIFSENHGIKAHNYSEENPPILMIPPTSIKMILQRSINLFKLICNNIDINQAYNFDIIRMIIEMSNRSVTKYDTLNHTILRNGFSLNVYSDIIPILNPLGFKVHTFRKRNLSYLKHMIDSGLDLTIKLSTINEVTKNTNNIFDIHTHNMFDKDKKKNLFDSMNHEIQTIVINYLTLKKNKKKLAFTKSLHSRLGTESIPLNLKEIELFDEIFKYL